MAQKMVKIQNGELTGECTEEALEAWVENGWTAVDDGDSDGPETVEVTGQHLNDPTDQTQE